ncbi:MAG: DUF4364 family protein [Lachnospiraceae bacterium]|nr:DUF4364 family protein [Lachnospiraceae bacterium]MBR5739525.1 DUF4364 family protein [Lachnospiraceae bacterium]
MTDPETLYKLMVLYLLKKVNFSLSNPQLWTFFEEKGYTNYFTFQQTLQSLLEANLISSETIRNAEQYEITKQGDEALYYFINDIPEGVRNDLDEYISVKKFKLRTKAGVTTDYYRTQDLDYMAHMKVRDGKSVLMDISLSVPTEEQAKQLSEHLEAHAEEIYAHIMKMLI